MRTILLTTAALAAFALPALAQESEVAPLIVTTRLPSLADDQPGVRTIGEAEIERRGATTAYDLLAGLPGLSVYRTGAYGGVTTVRQRGATNDKTLVLIDGVPQNDASQIAGGYDFARVSLDEVQKVEVLSGPQGSLWGSDAIGGVISFTTREPSGLRLRAETGSFGTTDGAISFGRSAQTWGAGAFVSATRTDGVSSADQRNGNAEADGWRNTTYGGRGRFSLSGVELDGRVEVNSSKLDTDGYPFPLYNLGDTDDVAQTDGWNGFVRARGSAGGLRHDLSYGASSLDRDYAGSSGAYGYQAERNIWRYVGARGGTQDAFSFAFGAEREETKATLSSRLEDELSASAAFATGRWKPNTRTVLTGSLRYDDPGATKAATTAKLAAAFDAGGGWRLLASAGQGFKTPSVSQTLCDFCFPAGPSVGLKPERAQGLDLGAAWRSAGDRINASLTLYRLEVKDQIDYGAGRYVNLERTETDGVEAQIEARLTEAWSLKAAWSYTDAIDETTQGRLLRVPVRSGSLVLSYGAGPLSGALSARHESSQLDTAIDGFSIIRRKGFTVADLAGAYELRPGVALTARVENIADTHFQEVAGYGEPGRAAFFGLRVRR